MAVDDRRDGSILRSIFSLDWACAALVRLGAGTDHERLQMLALVVCFLLVLEQDRLLLAPLPARSLIIPSSRE